MPGWRIMVGGLIIWAAHFFTVYIVASVFHSSMLARGLTLLATGAALVAGALLFKRVRKPRIDDPLARWMASLGTLAIGVAMLAVLWQGLPALLV